MAMSEGAGIALCFAAHILLVLSVLELESRNVHRRQDQWSGVGFNIVTDGTDRCERDAAGVDGNVCQSRVGVRCSEKGWTGPGHGVGADTNIAGGAIAHAGIRNRDASRMDMRDELVGSSGKQASKDRSAQLRHM